MITEIIIGIITTEAVTILKVIKFFLYLTNEESSDFFAFWKRLKLFIK